ncbi:MAG: hypothetical protein ACP5TW_06505, partial [Thermoplasmata archaeon]
LGEINENKRVIINSIDIFIGEFVNGNVKQSVVLEEGNVISYVEKEKAIIINYEDYLNFDFNKLKSQSQQSTQEEQTQKPQETKRFIDFEAFSKKPVDVGFIKTFEELSKLIKAYENRDKEKIKEIIEKYGDGNE